ncbi:hypothetical protein HAX54_000429 [Datura stramonium]|uniref:Uncharacterized protein n=1 Tax=Datura stramonium TaxID=4076 RepID=A0ABS8T1P9_DATST|nr:hypothetical protein [Datura stramonium]
MNPGSIWVILVPYYNQMTDLTELRFSKMKSEISKSFWKQLSFGEMKTVGRDFTWTNGPHSSGLHSQCAKELDEVCLTEPNARRLLDTELYGILPEGVFHLSNLESLDLSQNPRLNVRFPRTKWNSSASLTKLHLYGVNFTGRIPESFSHLTSLLYLDMSYSNLSGSIPKPLWNLTNIEALFLDDNHLEGPISHLLRFEKISGKIQEFKSKTLSEVALNQNQLQGPIPKSLLNQQTLAMLLLSQNNFSGQIASTICNLKKLEVLDLGSNNLNGTIPTCLGGPYDDYVMTITTKELDFDSVPIATTNMIVDLSRNTFEGRIPNIIGDLVGLRTLNLSHNDLGGFKSKMLLVMQI